MFLIHALPSAGNARINATEIFSAKSFSLHMCSKTVWVFSWNCLFLQWRNYPAYLGGDMKLHFPMMFDVCIVFRSHYVACLICYTVSKIPVKPPGMLARKSNIKGQSQCVGNRSKRDVEKTCHSAYHESCTWFALCCGLLWLSVPYPSGLLHGHWGNYPIAPVPVK